MGVASPLLDMERIGAADGSSHRLSVSVLPLRSDSPSEYPSWIVSQPEV